MFRRNQTTYLPLLISGLPILAVEWLRIAGLPVTPFQTPAALSRSGQTAAGQIVLFDARSASGRLDARTARESGAAIINVAEFLSRETTAKPDAATTLDRKSARRRQADRAAFFDELKLRIESAGGFWLRLGDYPFPYQSAACRCLDADHDLRTFSKSIAVWHDEATALPAQLPGSRDAAFSAVRKCYQAGQPVFLVDSAADGSPLDGAGDEALDLDDFPLMWRTDSDELLRWRRVRAQLKLAAWKKGTTYHIECTGDAGGFRPTIELWLGKHVASLPLVGETMTIREEGIVFVQEHRRHAAGMAAGWTVEPGRSDTEERFAHQPA
jgi:hypothetical protein